MPLHPVRWSTKDSCHIICLVGLFPDPETFNHVITSLSSRQLRPALSQRQSCPTACPSLPWVYSHPLQQSSHVSHPTMFLWRQLCHGFPAVPRIVFPVLPVCCLCWVRWCRHSPAGLLILILCGRRSLIQVWSLSAAFMVSSASITFMSLLCTDVHPLPLLIADRRTLLPHCPSSSDMQPPGFPLASLVLPLTPFKSGLNFF